MLSYLIKRAVVFVFPAINKRVLSNLIEMMKPYISETVLTLDKWEKRCGKYDGDGKFTVYDSVEELTVGDRWYAGYDDAVWFLCECDVPVCSDGEKLYFNMNFGGETVIKIDGEIIGSVSSKLHNGWVCRENIPLPKKYEGIVLDAFKMAQNSDGYILRVFEAYSSRGKCEIEFNNSIDSVTECNLMENDIGAVPHNGKSFVFDIKPNEVKTFRIKFNK